MTGHTLTCPWRSLVARELCRQQCHLNCDQAEDEED